MLQIVTDSGADLSELQKQDLPIHIVQLGLSLDGENYGKDIKKKMWCVRN